MEAAEEPEEEESLRSLIQKGAFSSELLPQLAHGKPARGTPKEAP